MRLKQPSVSQRPRRATYSDLIAPQAGTVLTEKAPLGLWFFQWEKEPKVDIQLLRHCGIHPGMPTQVLPHRAHWENLQGSTPGDQIDREGGWVSTTRCSDLGGPYSCLQWCLSRGPSQLLCRSAVPNQWPCLLGSVIDSSALFGSPANKPYRV